VRFEGLVDEAPAVCRQANQHAAPVVRVGFPADERSALEPVESHLLASYMEVCPRYPHVKQFETYRLEAAHEARLAVLRLPWRHPRVGARPAPATEAQQRDLGTDGVYATC